MRRRRPVRIVLPLIVLLALLALLVAAAPAEAREFTATSPSSSMTLDVAKTATYPNPFTVRGTLLDGDGVGLPGRVVDVYVDNFFSTTATTNSRGTFSASISFPSFDRSYALSARFTGDSAVPSTQADTTVFVLKGDLLVPEAFDAARGATLDLPGNLSVNDAPYPNASVTLTIGGATVGPVLTDEGGNFTLNYTIPATQAPGTLTARYTANFVVNNETQQFVKTHDIRVLMNGTLQWVTAPPTRWVLNAPTDPAVTVNVTDDAGVPIPGVTVEGVLALGNESATLTATTDATGAASFTVAQPGDAAGNWTFNVTATHTHVTVLNDLTGNTDFQRLSVRWAGETPDVLRNTTVDAAFVVRFGATNVTWWNVSVAGGDPPIDDVYPVGLTAERNASLATRQLHVDVPDWGLNFTLPWKVHSRSVLTVQDAEIIQGREGRVLLRLVDEVTGEPVSGSRVSANLSASNGWFVTDTGTTGEDGQWEWVFDAADVPAEPLSLSAGTDASEFRTAAVGAASLTPRALPEAFSYLPLVFGAVVLAGAGGSAVYAYRKRQASAPAAAATAMAFTAAKGRVPALRMELAEVDDDLPPVWGADEPFRVRVAATGIVDKEEQPLAGRTVRLETPDGSREATLGDDGTADVGDLRGPLGDYPLTLVMPGDDRFDEARVTLPVRLVDYREEVSREFDGLVDRARGMRMGLGKQTTPREFQWTLEEELDADLADELEDVARIVENANYSTTSVGRGDYLTFMRARRALDPHLSEAVAALPDEDEEDEPL